jgi:DedD protein
MKERLIGACILVALVVAVVPELLSGPKSAPPAGSASTSGTVRLPADAPDPVRNVTVDLATSKPAVAEITVAPPQQSFPIVSSGPSNAVPTGTEAAGTAHEHPVETQAPPPTSGQSVTLQLGSFANRSNADKLVHQLKAQGFSIYMNQEGSGAAARYRVRVGPLADRDAAERMISKLKGLGHAATIVGPR